ncbi:MAG: FKBP-type peptidyl-prolyl cis-trans isomerase [Bacteroidia bacterium]
MKKNIFIVCAAVGILIFPSCKLFRKTPKAPVMTTTSDGLQYMITTKGTGIQPQKGDMVTVNYVGKLMNDTVFDASEKHGKAYTFRIGDGDVIKGWDEGIMLMHEGDKASFVVPPSLAYADKVVGKIPANSTLKFDVELVKVTPAPRPFDIAGKDTITTASGLKYILVKSNPDSIKAVKGDKVTVNYSGYLLDGKMFDSSVQRGEPFSFNVGKGQVIKGWDEALLLLHKGDKARLIIPYNIAYGEKGYGPIPPAATLVFDVEMINIAPEPKPTPYDIQGKKVQTTASGLQYIVISQGTGAKAEAGKTVKVDYTGYLEDGSIFDSSVERGQPIEFPLGEKRVIPGWEEGIALMHEGDKFRLIIPYNLAYGEQGRPPVIPAKATLTFDVQLISVK